MMAMLLEALSIGTMTYLLWNSVRYLMTFSSHKIGLVCCGVLVDFRCRILLLTFFLTSDIQLSKREISRLYLLASFEAHSLSEKSIALIHLEWFKVFSQ